MAKVWGKQCPAQNDTQALSFRERGQSHGVSRSAQYRCCFGTAMLASTPSCRLLSKKKNHEKDVKKMPLHIGPSKRTLTYPALVLYSRGLSSSIAGYPHRVVGPDYSALPSSGCGEMWGSFPIAGGLAGQVSGIARGAELGAAAASLIGYSSISGKAIFQVSVSYE